MAMDPIMITGKSFNMDEIFWDDNSPTLPTAPSPPPRLLSGTPLEKYRCAELTLDMDVTLRCNELDCRKALDFEAIVTNCSHVFCIDCAQTKIFAAQTPDGQSNCSACSTLLILNRDVSRNYVNPLEEAKSSLSGIHPTVIVEMASRAMSFWAYQMQQEIIYQEHVAGALRESYNQLTAELDNTVVDANKTLGNLQSRVKELAMENEDLAKQNHELTQKLHESNREKDLAKVSSWSAGVVAAEDDSLTSLQQQYDHLRTKNLNDVRAQYIANAVDRSLGNQNQISMTPQRTPVPPTAASTVQASGGGVPLGTDTFRRGGCRVSLPNNFATQAERGVETSRSPNNGPVNMGPPPFIPNRNAVGSPNQTWGTNNGILSTPLRVAHSQGQSLVNPVQHSQQRPSLGLVSDGTLNSIANGNFNLGGGMQRPLAQAHARNSGRHFGGDYSQYSQGLGRARAAGDGITLN